MDDFTKILSLCDDEKVKYGVGLSDEIGVGLVLGHTRHVIRYGVLSDGHEKLTPAQRYYQSKKEIYVRALSVVDHRAAAMESQANIIEAENALNDAGADEIKKLRAEARLLRAKNSLRASLTSTEDLMREIDELNKVRIELKDYVETKYPGGIEQAEPDNWKAVFDYRMLKERVAGTQRESVSNIPIDPKTKAELGYSYGRVDAIAPLAVSDEAKCRQIAGIWEAKQLIERENDKSKMS